MMSDNTFSAPPQAIRSSRVPAPWETGLLYTLHFFAPLALSLPAAVCLGFPQGIGMIVVRVCFYSAIAWTLWYIIRSFRLKSFFAFAGLTWPLIVFWSMLYTRMCYDNWMYGEKPWIRTIGYLMTPLAIAAFSVAIDRKTVVKVFYWTYYPLWVAGVILICLWGPWFWDGHSSRIFYSSYSPFLQKVIVSVHSEKNLRFLSYFIHGGCLALASLWGGWFRKVPFVLAVVGYVVGSIFVVASVYKSALAAVALGHFLFFVTEGKWRSPKGIVVMLLAVLLHVGLVIKIGSGGSGHLHRFGSFIKTLSVDLPLLQTSQETSKEVSSFVPPQPPEPSIPPKSDEPPSPPKTSEPSALPEPFEPSVSEATPDGAQTLAQVDASATPDTADNDTVRTSKEASPSGSNNVYDKALGIPQAVITNQSGSVKLDWGAVSDVDGYEILRQNPNGSWTSLAETPLLQYIDTDATPGVAASYIVRSYKGTFVSGFNIVYGKARLGIPKVTVTNQPGSVKLDWGAVNGAERYEILRQNSDGSWTSLAETPLLQYIDTDATPGVAAGYIVRSYKGTVVSGSGVIYGKARLGIPQVALTDQPGSVTLDWPVVNGAERYEILRQNPDDTWTVLASTQALQHIDTGASPVWATGYIVRAYRGTSVSGFDVLYGKAQLGIPQVVFTNPPGRVRLDGAVVTGIAPRRNPGAADKSVSSKALEPKSFADMLQEVLVRDPRSIRDQFPRETDPKGWHLLATRAQSDSRVAMIGPLLSLAWENPMTGYGLCFVIKLEGEYYKYEAHNQILKAFLAVGMIGGALYVAILLRCLCDVWIVFTRYPEYGWIALFFLMAFGFNFFDVGLQNDTVFWFSLVALRACVRSRGNAPQEIAPVPPTAS